MFFLVRLSSVRRRISTDIHECRNAGFEAKILNSEVGHKLDLWLRLTFDRVMMDIRQLRYFVQIVECGSLSKASRQLLIAQPALSQQLAKLEGLIGKPLLHRSSKGVWPTDNGLALY